MTKESKVPTISVIPDNKIDLQKVYHHGVYVLPQFTNYCVVNMKQDQVDIEAYPDDEEMQEVILNNEREFRWRMVLGGNEGGVD